MGKCGREKEKCSDEMEENEEVCGEWKVYERTVAL